MAGYVAPRTMEPEVADICTEEATAAALLAGVPRDRAFFTSRPRDAQDVVTYCKVHKVHIATRMICGFTACLSPGITQNRL